MAGALPIDVSDALEMVTEVGFFFLGLVLLFFLFPSVVSSSSSSFSSTPVGYQHCLHNCNV